MRETRIASPLVDVKRIDNLSMKDQALTTSLRRNEKDKNSRTLLQVYNRSKVREPSSNNRS